MRESKPEDGYYDKDFDAYMVSVSAGFFAWTRSKKVALTTTLGSCVSVCVCDTHLGIGGMNHFLLPGLQGVNNYDRSEAARYGSAAIEILLNALYSNGASKNDLMVKVFGGGKVISGVSADVGRRNVEFAKNFFKNEKIRVHGEDSGGITGRKVVFFPATGRVLVRPVQTGQDINKIAEAEKNTYLKIANRHTEGDVELFD